MPLITKQKAKQLQHAVVLVPADGRELQTNPQIIIVN